jgi:glutamyl-tRNA reductase
MPVAGRILRLTGAGRCQPPVQFGAVRDLICTEETEVPGVLARLSAAGLSEFMWLSTCDRVEVLAASDDPARAAVIAADALAERAGMTARALAPELYTLTGGDAVRHLFAVACSLDSQVVGEPHVLGQVKAAHRASVAAHVSGPELERCSRRLMPPPSGCGLKPP